MQPSVCMIWTISLQKYLSTEFLCSSSICIDFSIIFLSCIMMFISHCSFSRSPILRSLLIDYSPLIFSINPMFFPMFHPCQLLYLCHN